MIKAQRLAATFVELAKINSVSKHEANIAKFLRQRFTDLGARVMIDDAGKAIGGECGNLFAMFPGQIAAPPLLLNAHMDTVEPGNGIIPVFKDGVFTSSGDTILGADDKSAIAILLEVMAALKENKIAHGPLELVMTVCEEIGLLGAKNMDFSLISAPYGYSLDAGDPEGIVTRSPSANRLEFIIHGKDAHAGASPEKGINAIFVASRAIASLDLGRIDEQTTCNIGIIKGGVATNIVPNLVEVRGEARSLDSHSLEKLTKKIVSAFEHAIFEEKQKYGEDGGLPCLDTMVAEDFISINIPETHPLVQIACEAAKNLGWEMKIKETGGGADANVFCSHGIMTGVLGTGMTDVHTLRESVRLDDMVKCAQLVLKIIKAGS